MIRELNSDDFAFLRNAEHLPDPKNILVAGASGTTGYGFLEVFAEALLILDQTKTNKDKVTALKDLLDKMVEISKSRGLPAIYVFVNDPSFGALLKKHFNFEPCIGEALVLKLEK